jgi:hypothetical protein
MSTLRLTLLALLALTQLARAELSFERDIRPIVKAHCFQCHGEDGKTKGGVDLRLRRFMLRELKEGGGHVMVPGKPAESEMLRLVREGEMPKEGRKLTAEEVAKIEQWIAAGAPTLRDEPAEVPKFFITEEEREFWSFKPIARPAGKNSIDEFIAEKLAAAGLDFAPPASPRTLVRRVTLDLTGLPPAPEEVDAFVKACGDGDPSTLNTQLSALCDRLLATPAYGERWAQHWLDVAGYADTNGMTEADSPRPHAWHFRDYVIRSIAADKPWNRFIVEQLAGDELAGVSAATAVQGANDPAKRELLTATGFLRMTPDGTGDEVPDQNAARNQVIAETLKVVSSSLLGLTVGCAQCHDHRYDPIAQADYYRFRAIFEPALDWKHWRRPNDRLVSLYTPAQWDLAQAIEGEAREWELVADARNAEHKDRIFAERLAALPERLREPIRLARATPPDKRTPEQHQLFKEHPGLNVDAGSLDLFDKKADDEVKAMRAEGSTRRAAKPPEPFLMTLTEVADRVPETHLLHRGDHDQPREKIAPGELTILRAEGLGDFPEKAGATSTGRRLAYARWLTSGRHPLVARVLVNRVWLHHFGRGIVNTPGDFGALGERPTHPELLDWLASEFMANGWRLKPLHKLIVTSRTYRQSSRNDAALASDPDNQLFARFKMRRLDAETLRDAMLAVTGKLNLQQFGAPVGLALDPAGRIVIGNQKKDANGDPTGFDPVGDQEFRRSIYLQMRRRFPLTMFETFDAPVMSPNCEARVCTTVAPQSLLLMNDAFTVNAARALAERLRREHAGDARGQLAAAWRLLYGVAPADSEMRSALAFLAEQSESLRARAASAPPKKDAPPADPQLQSLASLCQALLSANRFLYVE